MRRNTSASKLREMGAKKKIDIAFKYQFDELQKKVIRASERLGIDLQEDGAIERLLMISNGATDSDTGVASAEWEISSWEERLLAISFSCSNASIRTGIHSDKELIDSLCLGNWAVGFLDGMPGTDAIQNQCIPCMIKEAIDTQKSLLGKTAVSHRADQQQKEGWKAHCKMAKESGVNIATLEDLTNIAGYDPLVLKVAPRTLKAWAKEEGIEFKPGRPKK